MWEIGKEKKIDWDSLTFRPRPMQFVGQKVFLTREMEKKPGKNNSR